MHHHLHVFHVTKILNSSMFLFCKVQRLRVSGDADPGTVSHSQQIWQHRLHSAEEIVCLQFGL